MHTYRAGRRCNYPVRWTAIRRFNSRLHNVIDGGQLIRRERLAVDRIQIRIKLRDTADAEQCGCDTIVTKRPGQRHLLQRLATLCGDLLQGADALRDLLGGIAGVESTVPRLAGFGGVHDRVEVAMSARVFGGLAAEALGQQT